jgi:hypothetical protein
MTDKAGKARASSQQADVAKARHQLFKVGFARIKDSIEHLYFLEPISLIESLLADRMESRTSDHVEAFSGFMNLGPLLKLLAACETDARLRLLNQEVDRCRQSRNAIHEVMKIDAHHISPRRARVAQLRDSAIPGRNFLLPMTLMSGRVSFARRWLDGLSALSSYFSN